LKLTQTQVDCQIPCLRSVAVGNAEVPPAALGRRLKLAIRRRLSPRHERTFKRRTNSLLNWFAGITKGQKRPLARTTAATATILNAGDLVRVRSEEEIKATLNHWRQLKGCTFMPEMAPYCGTTQRVHKRMARFVDERDLRVKRTKGIILLEGLHCEGTADFGPCDRSCFYFWREEWLEKIDTTRDGARKDRDAGGPRVAPPG
jgi:hypothetical protein